MYVKVIAYSKPKMLTSLEGTGNTVYITTTDTPSVL